MTVITWYICALTNGMRMTVITTAYAQAGKLASRMKVAGTSDMSQEWQKLMLLGVKRHND